MGGEAQPRPWSLSLVATRKRDGTFHLLEWIGSGAGGLTFAGLACDSVARNGPCTLGSGPGVCQRSADGIDLATFLALVPSMSIWFGLGVIENHLGSQ